MAKKISVFITGVYCFIGQKLIEHICSREDIGTIIGIDIVEPPGFMDKIIFVRHDVRDDMSHVMSRYKIDWAIHAAFVVSVLHNKKIMEDIDINGTKNFLNACEKLKIKHVMQISSTTAYGAHVDNLPLLTEESLLLRHPWVASNKKIKEAGYSFKYNTKETYETFAELVRNY